MLKKWFERLFHIHNYEIIDNKEIYVYNSWSDSNLPAYRKIIYMLKCTECGKIKIKKFRT